MSRLRRAVVGMGLVAGLLGLGGCEFDKPLSYSWSIRTQFDLPAGWDANYFSLGLWQEFDWQPGQLKVRGSIKTPKGTVMPPTGFTWTLRQYDAGANMKAQYELPGTVKVRKYNGRFKLDASLPGFAFAPGDQLLISGRFDSTLPTGSSLGVKLKYRF